MKAINPKLLIALAAVLLFVAYIKISNPYREFSTTGYWETASTNSVAEIPDEALLPGNKNGGVLMWAAMATNNPDILTALVERGADINESDGVFMGTPLSAAAGYTSNPDIIDRLIELGADIHQQVNFGEDALMVAARYNRNSAITEKLIEHGANPNRTNHSGQTALAIAVKNSNTGAKAILQPLTEGN